ncbi:MAG: GNAT family N-acetyltransferase [Saprospiraceae bacterium]|nr:GNAT family N-acetyltransferase [Saprospiraceae bacterium]
MKDILDRFFAPKAIAVFGATIRAEKVGFALMQNLKTYGGKVYPVNPKYTKIDGLKCYARAKDLPKGVDLAVITTPPDTVAAVVEACGKAGITCAMVLTAGFKEAGEAGQQRYRALRQAAQSAGVRLIGPNCLGLQSPALHLNASFASAMPPAGRLAFISQSGAMGSAILDWACDKKVGFSHFVSLGSMADIAFDHLIDYFGTDSHTACILMYMENMTHARRFMSAARAFARSKPIVVLKAGATREGARAAFLHTGSAAGDDAVYDAAFRRAGIIRVQTIQQLFDCAQALAYQPLPAGNRLAIVTNAGGPAILAADALAQRGGVLASLQPDSILHLQATLPEAASTQNPVDILGDGTADQFRQAVHTCLFDPNVDGLLAILTAQSMTDAKALAEVVVRESKPVFAKPVYAAWMGQKQVADGRKTLDAGKIPWYPFPERAVTVFMHMVRYRETLDLLHETPTDLPVELKDIHRKKAAALIALAHKQGRTLLNKTESKQLLAAYGIPVHIGLSAKSEDEAVQNALETGFPVAMKIDSPDIWRKSEVHGVRLGIETEAGVRQVYRFLMENVRRIRPDARLLGVTVERMCPSDYALFIGAHRDPVFGPVIAFGAGGPGSEIWMDRTVGLPPLNMALAKHLIRETRIGAVLDAYVSKPGAPLEQLQRVLCRFAYLLMDFPDVAEIAIEPYAMNDQGGSALDAQVRIERTPSAQREPYEHLSIHPYPTQWIRPAKLKDDTPVLLRPIRPEDEPLEAELVKQSSRESLYFRFFGFVPGLGHAQLARFTHIDYDREMAIVAIVENKGKEQIIGVVRIVGDAWRENAEYAILVADAWHGHGVGSMLTDYIIEIARAQGYKIITASFLKTNGAMRRLFERKKFRISGGQDEADNAVLVL